MKIPDYLIIFQVKRITNLQCIRTGPYGFPGTRVDVIPAGAKMSSTWCKYKLLGFHTGIWLSSTHRRGSWHDHLYWGTPVGMTTVHLNRGMNLCDAALPSSMTVIHLLAVLIVVMPFIIQFKWCDPTLYEACYYLHNKSVDWDDPLHWLSWTMRWCSPTSLKPDWHWLGWTVP